MRSGDGCNPSFQLDFSCRQMNTSLYKAGIVKAGSRMRWARRGMDALQRAYPGAMTARVCDWSRCASRSRTIS
jgi:hypothetical protein